MHSSRVRTDPPLRQTPPPPAHTNELLWYRYHVHYIKILT